MRCLHTSPLRDGGLGITIEPCVGVGVCLDCFGGKAGWISPTSENKSPRSRKKGIIVNSDVFHTQLNLSKIWSVLKTTNQHNGTKTKERDFPWKVVWGSAVAHMDDPHLEALLGSRQSTLSDFGTDSVPVNHYLVSCCESTYKLHLNKVDSDYFMSETRKD
jgi:hypothetical protein